jgi:membrane dipeptidase
MASPTPIPIIDGHNDTVLDLVLSRGTEKQRSFFIESERGQLDLPRARKGNLGGGFFAIFTPDSIISQGPAGFDITITETAEDRPAWAGSAGHLNAQWFTMAMAATLFKLEAESNGQFKVVRTAAEMAEALEQGVLAAIFHIEGAEAIDTNLDALYVLYEAGLRSLGIVWSRSNAFGHGVPFGLGSPDTGPGLTEAGKALVKTCNELGILLDLSHLNEKGFWDVAESSSAPLVATHSGVYAISPVTRNLTDEQLDAIRGSNGIIGINFHVGFLRPDGQMNADTPLSVMADHIDYIVEKIGIDHVAFGSDFDGATMPQELGTVAGLPKLMATLTDRGYDDSALRKIAYQNWLRILEQTWK